MSVVFHRQLNMLIFLLAATGKANSMRQMCALCLVFILAGCGAIQQDATAQKWLVSSQSSISNPQHVIIATGNGASDYILHVTPIGGGQARVVFSDNLVARVGNTVSLQHTEPATPANDGTYTVASAVNPPTGTTYIINCSTCVQYDDDTGLSPPHSNCVEDGILNQCSNSFDAFPTLLTDSQGLIHNFYVNGTGQQGGPCGWNAVWKRSSDNGVTWTNPVTLFADNSGNCSMAGFSGYNNSFGNIALGQAPNGDVIAAAALTGTASAPVGIYWNVYDHNGGMWTGQRRLTGNAPDGGQWWVVYGPISTIDAKMAMFISSTGNNGYLIWSSDNGRSWGNPTLITASGYTKIPTLEGSCLGDGVQNHIVCFMRDVVASSGGGPFVIFTSGDEGKTWTATRSAIGLSSGTSTNWEVVAPWTYCPTLFNSCILLYGQRYDASATGGAMMALTFKPSDIYQNPLNTQVPQTLDRKSVV